MADDPNKRGAPDRSRMNLSEDHEVRYWTKDLGASEQRLRELVKQHGNSSDAIRSALGKAAERCG